MKKLIQRMLTATLLPASLVIAGCGGSSSSDDTGAPPPPQACDRNQAVYDIMESWYYWYADMPAVDPADYPTPEALLEVLTQPEQDLGKSYSYLTTKEAEAAYLNNAEITGFGINPALDQEGRLFLQESFVDGPAHEAGMRRGDQITAINGTAVSTMSVNQLNAALFVREGTETTFDGYTRDGVSFSRVVIAGEYQLPIVANVRTNLGDGDTTYIFFRSFVNPAFDQLDAAFAQMRAAGDTQLVLDLRYNGGGLLLVAEHLGGLIAGVDHGGTTQGVDDGKLVAKIAFNDKHANENMPFYIDTLANSVDVTDLVVITTPSTASASEMIINGLQPHMNVATVGTTTYGKPVGQSGFEVCTDDILRPIAFKVVNSLDKGEYFDGIPANCEAYDDVLDPLGEPTEASLQAALFYLANGGACDPATQFKALRMHAKRQAAQPLGDPLVRDGWDVLTGGAR